MSNEHKAAQIAELRKIIDAAETSDNATGLFLLIAKNDRTVSGAAIGSFLDQVTLADALMKMTREAFCALSLQEQCALIPHWIAEGLIPSASTAPGTNGDVADMTAN